MQITYDPQTDTMNLIFCTAHIAESDEEKPGIILDYDAGGQIVSMEILDASKRMPDVTRVEFQVMQPGLSI